jgi:hypothetical protein
LVAEYRCWLPGTRFRIGVKDRESPSPSLNRSDETVPMAATVDPLMALGQR